MKELQQKQRFKRIVYSIPSIILLGLVAIMLIKGSVGVVLKERESASKVRDLEARVGSLELREMELKSDIDRLQTDEGVMEEIKGKFRVSEEGEHVAIIVDERARATSASEEEPKETGFKGFWQKVKGLWK